MTTFDTGAGTETVLVTGGTGFIGSHLARRLVDDGHEVVAFDAAPDATLLERLGVAGTVEIRRGDVTDLAALARTVREQGVTRVVHLAALLSEDVRTDELAATRVNALGANHVLEAARLLPDRIDRVVVASSETVYGPGSAYDGPVPEDALLSPDSPYAAAKRHAECLSRRYREDHGVPAVALRPTGVFGPFRRSFTAFSDLFERPAVCEPVRVEGGGTAVSWLSVRDAADAFRRAALAPASDLERGVYNVRGEVATVAEAAETVRGVIPDAEVAVTDDADHDWSAQRLALERTRSDLGYEVEYGLEELTREYVDAVRRDAGLDPVD
ncbi:Nucleoside-diphosphate-sugar epimerase [Halorubrum aquaticum]|uniref:Nucleoside-diphosphate-sugar epimerase n=1 Tax=Halorubrum aquaticum TaxID=387340 RepID=A0A1I2ZG69_9EURY|nr:NAD(P)-dependent oxidoreductase [Halorubrum aquaticum]SFH36828.1 Nucleoside-diphosphate-sugar epimerase [Halorubrum aquaticum]